MTQVPVLAIGRSGILYDAVSAVAKNERYRVAAIITDSGYAEYDVDVDDFEALAEQMGAEFRSMKMISESMIAQLVDDHRIKIAISANWRYLIPPEVLGLCSKRHPQSACRPIARLQRQCDGELGDPCRRARDLCRRALHDRGTRRRERPCPQSAPAE